MSISRTASRALKEKRIKGSEEIDARIRGALTTINEDPTIKPTQANLAKLAECHLATLRDREWPLTQLRVLKDKIAVKNQIDKSAAKKKSQENRNKLTELNDKLSDEILYWFDKSMSLKVQCEALENERDRYRASSKVNSKKALEYQDKLERAVRYMSEIHGLDLEKVIVKE